MQADRTDKAGPRWRNDALIEASGVAGQDLPAGALYVVATPIGNLADVSLRALWVLAHVDAIAAEDTRVTRPLLARFGIDVPLLAAHQHNERDASDRILARLAAGERIALVTDAGTPGISDPGALIVRDALAAGLRVIPIAGASSAIAAVSAGGLSPGPFHFIGFLPPGSEERKRIVRAAAARGDAFVLFEAPHRARELMALLNETLAPTRRVVLARELSKKFETISVHDAAALANFAADERGEYVVLVDAAERVNATQEIDDITLRWLGALLEELPASRAAAVAAKASGIARSALYEAAMGLKR